MISNERSQYGSSSEWLTALRQDEAWLNPKEELLSADSSGRDSLRTEAEGNLGRVASAYWKFYKHDVGKTIQEVWDTGISLPNLKIQAISLLTLEWLEHNANGSQSPDSKVPSSAIVDRLKPIFYGDEEKAREFLKNIQGMKPTQITAKVKQLVNEKIISELSKNRDLWQVLHDHGLYNKSESNWNQQVK